MTARDRTPRVHSPGVLAIPLTRGLFALIDEADAPLVAPHSWHAMQPSGLRFYAARSTPRPEKKMVYMHRAILGLTADLEADHINGDGLDNRRANLRPATREQNARNTRLRVDNSTGFRGVYRLPNRAKPWVGRVKDDGRVVCTRYFRTAAEASRARSALAASIYGVFASPHISKEP
jgi:hypothetical protein